MLLIPGFVTFSLLPAAVWQGAPASPLPALAYFDAGLEVQRALAARDWERVVDRTRLRLELAPGVPEDWTRLGGALYSLGEFGEAAEAYERALTLGSASTPGVAFNLACCRALLGDVDAAFGALQRCLAARFEQRALLATDRDLAPLRADERWSALGAERLPGDVERETGWHHDLEYLAAEARRMHAGPSRPAFSASFEQALESLHAALPELSDDRIQNELRRIVALLNDGHSALYGPDRDSPVDTERRVLPFRFYLFPEGLYIIDGSGPFARHAGSRVLRIGARPVHEVLERMAAYRGVDNPMTWTWMGPQFYLRSLALLREVGAAPAEGPVRLTLEPAGGGSTVVEVEAGEYDLVRKLRPSPAAQGEVPLYLRDVDQNYGLERLPQHDALYVQFNQVRNGGAESLAAFAERVREELATHELANLIVDVRHNNGGNNALVRPLVRYLVEFDCRPDSRIFVVTSRNTFSAAQNFINHVERWTDAIFVGEPSSSSPNFTGEEAELLLPYSRLRGSLSTRYWQDSSPGDERPWIAPDLPVALTAADYFANRDPVLETILAFIARD